MNEGDESEEGDGDFWTTVDMKKSFAVYGDNFTNLLQYSQDCIMICSERTGHLLNIVTMQRIKIISLNSSVGEFRNNTNEESVKPLIYNHMVPETGNRFMIEFHKNSYIYLRTIETGERQILI